MKTNRNGTAMRERAKVEAILRARVSAKRIVPEAFPDSGCQLAERSLSGEQNTDLEASARVRRQA
jgi:hypothetical protein